MLGIAPQAPSPFGSSFFDLTAVSTLYLAFGEAVVLMIKRMVIAFVILGC
jgi:hypothetical protein